MTASRWKTAKSAAVDGLSWQNCYRDLLLVSGIFFLTHQKKIFLLDFGSIFVRQSIWKPAGIAMSAQQIGK